MQEKITLPEAAEKYRYCRVRVRRGTEIIEETNVADFDRNKYNVISIARCLNQTSLMQFFNIQVV